MTAQPVPHIAPQQYVMSDELIRQKIDEFAKWFTHVNFGNGIIARSTGWPDAPLDSIHMGVSKFDFIVRPNLPDLQGKRVLELGCNAGVNSIHMSRLGAAEVVGIDSGEHWPQVIEQAHFVKQALEWRCGTTYNISYIEADLADLPSLKLGWFDVVIALNCLYYLDEVDIAKVIRHVAGIADVFLIQCNTADHAYLGERPTPGYMEKALRDNGFAQVTVDWPWDKAKRKKLFPRRYHRPVVVGSK